MTFNSINYFLFLPVVYLVFYLVGDRARWCVLLAASLLFYAALNVPHLLLVLSLVAVTTYGFGIWLQRAQGAKAKRALIWGGIGANLLILVVMKYVPFLSGTLSSVASFFSFDAKLPQIPGFVAIGVSYYVFQAISYLVDIYQERQEPERHFGYFALYLAFFPKLLQGPIERASNLIPQLKGSYSFNYENMRSGMLLFACGLFKKVVIADRLGLFVNAVYGDVRAYDGLPLLLGTYAYAFQIYFDFSGYTDMALGSALLFNIQLTQNFNHPYSATSVLDFWRRWHLSFSRWLHDYIYKPMQTRWRERKPWGTVAAIIITFLVSGIWHGASWGYVIWGALHGIFMGTSILYRPYQKKVYQALGLQDTLLQRAWQIFCTFNLVCLTRIFFRAGTLEDAVYVLSNMLDFSASYAAFQDMGLRNFIKTNIFMGLKSQEFLAAILFLGLAAMMRNFRREEIFRHNHLMRWAAYYAIVGAAWLFHVENDQFLYFKF